MVCPGGLPDLNRHARDVLRFLEFSLDAANARLQRGAQVIPLRPKTLAVLVHLSGRPGQLVTKAELLDAVWPETAVGEWVLTSCVQELRRALADNPRRPRAIETAHGHGYRFVAAVAIGGSRDASPDGEPASGAMVGRERDLATLDGWLRPALGRVRQVGFVAGDPGIGKTTLVDAFCARLPADEVLIARGQCIEHHGSGEPYLPVLEGLGRLCAAPAGAPLVALLRRHAPTWLAQLPALLDAAEAEALQRRLIGSTRERMLREMAALVEALEQPLVLVLEDLHWSDYATLDLISALAERRDPAGLVIIGTYRPVDVVLREHPFKTVRRELLAHGRCRELWLELLSEESVAAYLRARCPGLAAAERLARAVYDRTDGNPLFVVNVVEYLVAAGALRETDGTWALALDVDKVVVDVPQGLRQMIAAQLERLDETDLGVLEVASVGGRTFSAALVAAALDVDDVEIETRLERLARAQQLVRAAGESAWADGTVAGRYELTHSLYQTVLYERVPPARRRRLHQRIAMRLHAGYGDHAADNAAELAFHFEAGGQPDRAVAFLEEGAARAGRRSADREAVALLEHGLALLEGLPATPERTLRAIRLSLALGIARQTLTSFADAAVERDYERARALSEATSDLPQLFQSVVSLHGLYLSQGRLDRAAATATQIADLMRRLPLPAIAFAGHVFIALERYHGGELAEARRHLELAWTLEDVPRVVHPMNLHVLALSYLALTRLHQGEPDRARQHCRAAIAEAAADGIPFVRGNTTQVECFLQLFLRDMPALAAAADEAIAIATESGFATIAGVGMVGRGRVLVARAEPRDGLALIRDGIARYMATGQSIALPTLLATLAEACAEAGALDDAQRAVAEAHARNAATGERRFEAELCRIEGELHGGRGDRQAAAASFLRAIDIAQRQGARWWELRARVSLVRLQNRKPQRAAALRALAALVASFTEGADTADLRAARALLSERDGPAKSHSPATKAGIKSPSLPRRG